MPSLWPRLVIARPGFIDGLAFALLEARQGIFMRPTHPGAFQQLSRDDLSASQATQSAQTAASECGINFADSRKQF